MRCFSKSLALLAATALITAAADASYAAPTTKGGSKPATHSKSSSSKPTTHSSQPSGSGGSTSGSGGSNKRKASPTPATASNPNKKSKSSGSGGSASGFASQKKLNDHYQKHGQEFGHTSPGQYGKAAQDFTNNPPKGTQKKTRQNGDTVSYDGKSNTFAAQKPDGTLKSMFKPKKGQDYYNRQK